MFVVVACFFAQPTRLHAAAQYPAVVGEHAEAHASAVPLESTVTVTALPLVVCPGSLDCTAAGSAAGACDGHEYCDWGVQAHPGSVHAHVSEMPGAWSGAAHSRLSGPAPDSTGSSEQPPGTTGPAGHVEVIREARWCLQCERHTKATVAVLV